MARESSASLLAVLNQLYARVTRRLWRGRASSYHEGLAHDLETDINPLMDAHLEKVKPAAPQVDTPSSQTAAPAGAARDEAEQTQAATRPAELAFVAGGVLDGLSEQFKQINNPVQLDRETGAKLKNSTWEHIHSALRLMRNGDADNARLHSRIANNALKEAGHFLPADEYQNLVSEVTDYLHKHPG